MQSVRFLSPVRVLIRRFLGLPLAVLSLFALLASSLASSSSASAARRVPLFDTSRAERLSVRGDVFPSSVPAGLPCRPALADRQRYGFVAVSPDWPGSFDFAQLGAGWVVDFVPYSPAPQGLDRALVIRTPAGYAVDPQFLRPLVDSNPGAIWLIGNEPDSVWQDYVEPGEYARIYHDLYTFIKRRDPTGRIAPGGIIQPTPIRLEYLDLILAAYQSRYGQPLPLDLWNIHNAILNEVNCDYDPGNCWGAGIPPGIDAPYGEVRSVDDNDNIALFEQQILDFRQWMADRGYAGYPLIITEFGILMPDDLGFDAARVNQFMSNAFGILSSAVDPVLGDPTDGNRMVQRWAWFSLDVPPWDPVTGEGFNGNLFDPVTGAITTHGLNYSSHTAPLLPMDYVDLTPGAFVVAPTDELASPTQTITRSVSVNIVNGGNGQADAFDVSLSYQGPSGSASLTERIPSLAPASSRWLDFTMSNLAPGGYDVQIHADADQEVSESAECNNVSTATVLAPVARLFLPLIARRNTDGRSASSANTPRPGRVVPGLSDAIAQAGFEEYPVPTPKSFPAQIALDIDGSGALRAVWLTEYAGNRIARFDPPLQQWQEYRVPTADSRPWGLALDAAGNVWFAETAADQIAKLDVATGVFSEFPIRKSAGVGRAEGPAHSASGKGLAFLPLIYKKYSRAEPWDIAISSDGAIWFTERFASKIGKLVPGSGTYTIDEYPIPTANSEPTGITVRTVPPYTRVAFAESAAGKLGILFHPVNWFEEAPVPTAGSGPQDVVFGSDEAIWTTERYGNKIAQYKVSTLFGWYEYEASTQGSEPYGIALEGTSAVWFTQQSAGKLARWTGPANPPAEYTLPDRQSLPTGVAIDSAGCAWYTAPGVNRIGRSCPPEGLTQP